MDFAYSDIIDRQRPTHADDAFGRAHPRMPRLNRAKLFAPYAALRGFEQCIASKRVRYVPKHVPDADEAYELNRRIGALFARCPNGRVARDAQITLRVTFFVPCADPNHEAFGRLGQYRAITGPLRRVDIPCQRLWVGNDAVDFADILEIAAPGSAILDPPAGYPPIP